MDPNTFLDTLRDSPDYENQIVHIHQIPPTSARFADPARPLLPSLDSTLQELGFSQLYTHQAAMLDAVRAGLSTVLVAGTSSGKTLAYHLPILESLLQDGASTALYLYPTKALAQDQLRRAAVLIDALARHDPHATALSPMIYDGDLAPAKRRKVRDEARIVFSNPDMIHAQMLPHHTQWSRFFSNLRYIVVDEVHSLRGIFGTHAGMVFRRLNRICRRHGSRPRYLCGSATIANPLEHATRLADTPMHLIDDDGAPRGAMTFVLWNPPPLKPGKGTASSTTGFAPRLRSGNVDAQLLLTQLLRSGFRTLAFTKSWLTSELLSRYTRASLLQTAPQLVDKVAPYRGGYLPEKRRAIEKALFNGDLMGVVSTNALELGIDLGDLAAVIIAGYPGTISSTWQQAGRAGRGGRPSLVFLVAYDTPINQYLMRHPGYFFTQSHEHALINPHNPYALASHLMCACHELPLTAEESAEEFGSDAPELLNILHEERRVRRVKGRYYSTATATPAHQVSLRAITGKTFTIVNEETEKALATVDAISAWPNFHPEAIYLHDDNTWIVTRFDPDKRLVAVKPVDVDYYTDPLGGRGVRVIDTIEEARPLADGSVRFGEVTAEFNTYAFQKIQFWTRNIIERRPLDLPPQILKTMAFWLEPTEKTARRILEEGRHPDDATMGLGHAFMVVTSLFAMCYPLDVRDSYGWECRTPVHPNTVFLFDNYEGGMGYSELAFQRIDQVLENTLLLIRDCPCDEGCPSCVGYYLRPFLRFDPQEGEGSLPDKEAALVMLHEMMGLESYKPKAPSTLRRTWRRRVMARNQVAEGVQEAQKRLLSERVRDNIRRMLQKPSD